MSESTTSAVECPVCGEEFDPSDAGGWCTNSECGEWQYIGEEVPEPTDADVSADDGPDEPANAEIDGVNDEANGVEDDETGDADGAGDDDGTEGEDRLIETPDHARDGSAGESASEDVSPTPAIRRLDDPAAGDPPEGADAARSSDDSADEGAASSEGDAEGGSEGEGESEDDGEAEGAPSIPDEEAGESACPDCGASVGPEDNFCASCGADLPDATAPTLDECPECGTSVAADDSFCVACGEDLDAAREALGGAPTGTDATDGDSGGDAPAPDSLVLRTHGEEIAVGEGETVGREVRRILTRNGADEEDVVLIHREHVRFVREDDGFALVVLGENPTALNGRYLSTDERVPVEPGDELELSDVATLSVEAP